MRFLPGHHRQEILVFAQPAALHRQFCGEVREKLARLSGSQVRIRRLDRFPQRFIIGGAVFRGKELGISSADGEVVPVNVAVSVGDHQELIATPLDAANKGGVAGVLARLFGTDQNLHAFGLQIG